jgi:uncharacterized protein (DUF1786 family)
MQLLTVDVGTGTQDILLFDAERELENNYKLVLPSPTVVAANRIRAATRARRRLVLDGVTMGGGPSHWAARDHVQAGLEVFATADAARTFDDDLAAVAEMGIQVVAPEEVLQLADQGATRVVLRDLALGHILQTLSSFGVDLHLAGLAVAVFDHGAAPPGCSDRTFRFDYLRDQLNGGAGLSGFAFDRASIPSSMTRLAAVASSTPPDLPLLVMDTAPAAVLGALDDPNVRAARSPLVANVGNFHCLAFHLVEGAIAGLFEHHTGELTIERLWAYLDQLADGTISNAEVFADQGHGALVLDPTAPPPDLIAVTGPRRALAQPRSGRHQPYFAVPHGDMMLTGNIGLLRAAAAHWPAHRDLIERRLGPAA